MRLLHIANDKITTLIDVNDYLVQCVILNEEIESQSNHEYKAQPAGKGGSLFKGCNAVIVV